MSSAASIVPCLASVAVSRVSVSASASKNARLSSSTMSCRRLPVFDIATALLITHRTSANGGVRAKQLSAPFCSISHARPIHTFAVTFVDVSPSTRDGLPDSS